ncbi:hypothetical protein GCM10027445_15060 [Amycolatopsis endophytica]|uniref:Uncharacterized protein n=1 Tax=Amycolatopsis endophytica TaxID=860233 RepID=A0A853B3B3_9PSEU|nr:hypothetical protein [Amycolatopsis endophytica]NYI89643.1 hypothetical protein [Amycolatopsis endophytica]
MNKALIAAAVTALALTTGAATARASETTFADCPALPAGADPAQWRCEVLDSSATFSFGTVHDLALGPMRLTFAEGQLDGEYAQVFGALRSEPVAVPGPPGTTLRFGYGGYSDFQSNDERKGEMDLVAEFDAPYLPRHCATGVIHSVLRADGPTEVVSTEPLTLRFATYDHELTVPATEHCGPLGRLVDHRLGLPAAPASYEQTTTVRLRDY